MDHQVTVDTGITSATTATSSLITHMTCMLTSRSAVANHHHSPRHTNVRAVASSSNIRLTILAIKINALEAPHQAMATIQVALTAGAATALTVDMVAPAITITVAATTIAETLTRCKKSKVRLKLIKHRWLEESSPFRIRMEDSTAS